MGKKMFARGYDASRAEKERQDKARENSGKKLWRFFLKEDGDEADLRFLTEEPVNFYEHNLKRPDGRFEQFCCTGGDDCPFCNDGDRPTYKGAYLVVDKREFEYTDRNGNKQKGKDQVRLFVQGMKVISQLDRISDKYGLSDRDVTIVRLGKGTQTTYTIERGEKEPLSKKEIEALLPEKIRDQYNGTMSSLMDIVEDQLMMLTKDYEPEDDEEEKEDTSYDEDDERIISYDDEEDEEPAPKKKKLSSKGGKKTMFKKSEQSLKPRAKNLMQNER
jgi:hypothetical protein